MYEAQFIANRILYWGLCQHHGHLGKDDTNNKTAKNIKIIVNSALGLFPPPYQSTTNSVIQKMETSFHRVPEARI